MSFGPILTVPLPFAMTAAAIAAGGRPSFQVDLQSSLIASNALGSPNPTFTRATTATLTDWEGRQVQVPSGCARFTGARYVRNSLSGNSNTLSGAGWTVDANATQTQGFADPFGGTSATKIVSTGATLGAYCALPTSTYVQSVWLKGEVGGETVRLGRTTVTVTLTTEWRRYSAAAFSDNFMRVGTPNAGTTFYAYGAMAEDVTGQSNQNPSEYVSVGVESAPYHGAGVDGVKFFNTLNGNTVASNVVTEATGASITNANSDYATAEGPFGYLPEVARTNSALHSRKLAAGVVAGAWAETDITATDNATGVDGAANACSTLTATANAGTILQAITLASAAAIFQPFVKRSVGTGTIEITLNGGTNWTDITAAVDAAAPNFYRLAAVTATLANPSIGYRLGTSGDAIIVDMNDCQNGTFRTSPIPTTTAAVTRNGDALTYTVAGNLLAAQGTAVCDVNLSVAGATFLYFLCASSVADQPILFGNNSSPSVLGIYDGTTVVTGAQLQTGMQTIAGVWGGSTMNTYRNGVAGTPGAFDGALQVGTSFSVGTRGTGGGGDTQPCGPIRFLRIYPQALSASQIAAL